MLDKEQKEMADRMLDTIMPIVIRYSNRYGARSVANTLLGVALGNLLEQGFDPFEIVHAVVRELMLCAKCPICGKTETHSHPGMASIVRGEGD